MAQTTNAKYLNPRLASSQLGEKQVDVSSFRTITVLHIAARQECVDSADDTQTDEMQSVTN